jgi:hypothetical protein
MRKIRVGETVDPRELITVVGERIRIPDQGPFVHLQFRRLAWARGAITLPTFPQPPREGESKLGLPADFLIGTDGRILALKYGVHAYDQWTVDELLSLAREPMPAQHEALPG